jgi:hypothetical protein
VSLESARRVADELRRRRQELVEDIARGDVAPGRWPADPRAGDVRVVVLAEAVPGVGKVRARRILDGLGLPATARWGELAPEDARRLVGALTAGGARPAAEQ